MFNPGREVSTKVFPLNSQINISSEIEEEKPDSAAITQPPLAGVSAMAAGSRDRDKEKEIEEVCEISGQCGYEPDMFDRQKLSFLPLPALRRIKNDLDRPTPGSGQTAELIFKRLVGRELSQIERDTAYSQRRAIDRNG